MTTRDHEGNKQYLTASLDGSMELEVYSVRDDFSQLGGGGTGEEYRPYSPFYDVTTYDFYYESSIWAYENDIVKGPYANYLNPKGECSRAQLVTYIWRALGSPEPKSLTSPFVDVTEGDYFFKAVLWAVEQGITTGIDATHFDPYTTCTRAHMATFLWRTDGLPNPAGMTTDFVDVPADAYFYKAVLWAVDRSITNGMDATHFGPNVTCTIGHAITFLYRLLG